MEKGPILPPYSALTSGFIDMCAIQNLYFSRQNQAVGNALREGLPSGYLTPQPQPQFIKLIVPTPKTLPEAVDGGRGRAAGQITSAETPGRGGSG